MAQRQIAQQRGVIDDINDWISHRNARAGQFAREAEAKGRQIWNDSIRTGQHVFARTQSELQALGANEPVPPARRSAERSWLESTPAKIVGGDLAERIGHGAGVARGAWHSAEGLGKGVVFGAGLLNPHDLSEKSSWGRVLSASMAAGDYVNRGIADPASVGRDIQNAAHQIHISLDPSATPMADSFVGEMKRRAGIGANQGELAWDVGSLAVGTPALKAVEGLGAVGDATSAAEFAAMGFSPAKAARLAEPYSGIGHHSPVPQALARDLGMPEWLRDSQFNVVKPEGMNQGDFYKFHFQTDPDYHGSGFSRKIGGGGWSGKKLGLRKYGLLNRLWFGTPTPLAGASAIAGAAGVSNYQPTQDPNP